MSGRLSPMATSISIHAPRVGSDSLASISSRSVLNFNPRSPCGERPSPRAFLVRAPTISIHAPRVGSDLVFQLQCNSGWISIHAPRVGSDSIEEERTKQRVISIHAPRVGSDWVWFSYINPQKDFNPRSPCGERHGQTTTTTRVYIISIHAPRVGSDVREYMAQGMTEEFQSTLPVWGATSGLRW